ncbi:MAG: ATP synthase F1 subunit delta [Bacteroidota bacterium]
MKHARVARRYAEALLDVSAGSEREQRVAADLEMLHTALHDSRELRMLLKSPVVKSEKKMDVLRAVFADRVDPLTMEFLALLAEKGREDTLEQVVVEFRRMRDDRLGIVTLDLSAATVLSKEQSDAIRQRFESLTGKKVRMAFSVDAGLKGGFRARVGDTVYDGSIRRQLELLRQRFAEGPITATP